MNFRALRVAGVIRDETAKLLLRDFDFDGALVTVTDVTVEPSFAWADIFVSVIPSEKASEALDQLAQRTGDIHHYLNRKMNIRPMPRIRFAIDHGPEKAADIEKILLREDNTETGHVAN
ncbi:MAG: ribosome-binding factor ribosome-binding factor [Candidatus Parcubacteria bacterium]